MNWQTPQRFSNASIQSQAPPPYGNWTAPQTDVGDITLYAAGVAAKSKGGSSGNGVYTAAITVPEPSSFSLQLAGCCMVAGLAAVRRRQNAGSTIFRVPL